MRTESCLLAIVFAALVSGVSPSSVDAQTASYHLHDEASTTAGLLQVTTAGPNSAPAAFQTIDLRNQTNLEYVIREFDTPAGVPGATGTIPGGSPLSFTLWMRTTAAVGTFFPRVRVKLNNAAGTLLCEATGASGLTTTLSPIVLSCNTSATVVMTGSDRLYVWAGVRVGVTAGKKLVRGEVAVE